jgi:hypothetical protein
MAHALSSIFSLIALHLSSEFIPLIFQFRMLQVLFVLSMLLLYIETHLKVSSILCPKGNQREANQAKSYNGKHKGLQTMRKSTHR